MQLAIIPATPTFFPFSNCQCLYCSGHPVTQSEVTQTLVRLTSLSTLKGLASQTTKTHSSRHFYAFIHLLCSKNVTQIKFRLSMVKLHLSYVFKRPFLTYSQSMLTHGSHTMLESELQIEHTKRTPCLAPRHLATQYAIARLLATWNTTVQLPCL